MKLHKLFSVQQAWLDSEKISPHSNVAFTTGCDHQVLGRKLLRCTPEKGAGNLKIWNLSSQNDFEWGGYTPPENYDGTREWRFGVWFSFSNRWFAGSISIFQCVSIVGKSFRYTVDIQILPSTAPIFRCLTKWQVATLVGSALGAAIKEMLASNRTLMVKQIVNLLVISNGSRFKCPGILKSLGEDLQFDWLRWIESTKCWCISKVVAFSWS